MIRKSVSIILLLLIAVVFQNCSNDPQPETDRVKTLLSSGTWKMNSVVVDGVEKTSIYSGLTLTFINDQITSTNGNDIWPEDLTWTFSDNTGRIIERGDGLSIHIDDVSPTALVLSLHWDNTTFKSGRTSSVGGDHVFSFTH